MCETRWTGQPPLWCWKEGVLLLRHRRRRNRDLMSPHVIQRLRHNKRTWEAMPDDTGQELSSMTRLTGVGSYSIDLGRRSRLAIHLNALLETTGM